ncbi:hypothetical protein [Streptococcus pluranimalium]|uniref:hypothetical protein n=1 Tax=Streptococcus pluranimalium TaxID=82348 RepID=UPI003F692CBC
MTIVGDNGAYIVEKGVLLKSFTISTDVIRQVIAFVEKEIPQAQLLLSGEKSAYVKIFMLQVDKDYFKIYYHQFREVPSFEMLPDDNFLKLSINRLPAKLFSIKVL